MSLSISIFSETESGEPGEPELLEGAAGLAGVEGTRAELWGSKIVASLGARFLPQLRHADLWVSSENVGAFRDECCLLLEHLEALEEATPWARDYISRCLGNLVAAADAAKAIGGGLVID